MDITWVSTSVVSVTDPCSSPQGGSWTHLPFASKYLRRILWTCFHLLTLTKLGGKGEIRTHTGHRMKVLHNHYATLPYRNTLKSAARKALYPRWLIARPSVLLYGRGTGTRTRIDRLKADYSSLWIIPPYGPRSENRTQFLRLRAGYFATKV